jgi:hypothetical protein
MRRDMLYEKYVAAVLPLMCLMIAISPSVFVFRGYTALYVQRLDRYVTSPVCVAVIPLFVTTMTSLAVYASGRTACSHSGRTACFCSGHTACVHSGQTACTIYHVNDPSTSTQSGKRCVCAMDSFADWGATAWKNRKNDGPIDGEANPKRTRVATAHAKEPPPLPPSWQHASADAVPASQPSAASATEPPAAGEASQSPAPAASQSHADVASPDLTDLFADRQPAPETSTLLEEGRPPSMLPCYPCHVDDLLHSLTGASVPQWQRDALSEAAFDALLPPPTSNAANQADSEVSMLPMVAGIAPQSVQSSPDEGGGRCAR